MAVCLTASIHYPNQHWLLISEVLWHSSESNFTGNAQSTILCNEFENSTFKITVTSQGPISWWDMLCYHGWPHFMIRDHFVYAPNQWETTLQCNVVSHWLGASTERSLMMWATVYLGHGLCVVWLQNFFQFDVKHFFAAFFQLIEQSDFYVVLLEVLII